MNTLQVTKQDQENVKQIVISNGAAKGSKVRIVPTGSHFAKSFDVFVNNVLFCKYFGSYITNTGRTEYTYTMA